MRILAIFTNYKGWTIQTLQEDCKTSAGPFIPVTDQATLMKLLRYLGAEDAAIEDAERDIRRWGHGSAWIDLIPGRKNLLRIRNLPWPT